MQWPAAANLVCVSILLSNLILLTSGRTFECYTGDKDILRRKQCPNMGNDFSDVCFKTVEHLGKYTGTVQRGCFNSKIAKLITRNDAKTGCHRIPSSIGKGFICLCETDLCNGTQTNTSSNSILILMMASVMSLWLLC